MTSINLYEEIKREKQEKFDSKYTTIDASLGSVLDSVYVAVLHNDVDRAKPILKQAIEEEKMLARSWWSAYKARRHKKNIIKLLHSNGFTDFYVWIDFFVGY